MFEFKDTLNFKCLSNLRNHFTKDEVYEGKVYNLAMNDEVRVYTITDDYGDKKHINVLKEGQILGNDKYSFCLV